MPCLLTLGVVFALSVTSSQGIGGKIICIYDVIVYSVIGQCIKRGIKYKCQANVSTVITIPCGDYPENNGTVFIYHNDSDFKGEVWLANTTQYYRLTVTVYDDNTLISCQPSKTGIGEYKYDISVLCKCICLYRDSVV